MKFKLEIKPAVPPIVRRILERKLIEYGYHFTGGGTHTDGSACDITFSDNEKEKD